MKQSSSFFLTKPAIIASIAYLILGFMILLPFNASWTVVQSESSTTTAETAIVQEYQSFGYRLLLLLLMLIPIALSIYSINCMMVGNCVVWSYVQAIIIAVWVLLFLTATFMSAESQKELSKSIPYAIM
jgi:hypothetical protein